MPYVSFTTGADMCAAPGAADAMFQQYGYAPLNVTGSNDKGDVMIGRAGGATTGGFAGAIWIEGLGWMRMREFLRKQGVVEADAIPFDGTGTVRCVRQGVGRRRQRQCQHLDGQGRAGLRL